MSDYNKLSYDELVQINEELRYKIADLKNFKKQQEEYDKCTARVYAPDKSYKDLEQKLDNFEKEKKKEIDELWNNTIVPLQNQVKDKNIQLDTAYNIDQNNKSRIKDLERVIEKQNVVINLAAGYISACKQFSNEYPINVKKWLMGGM